MKVHWDSRFLQGVVFRIYKLYYQHKVLALYSQLEILQDLRNSSEN